MLKRKLLLLFVSLVLVTGFFLIPVNARWASTLISYWKDFKKQKNVLDEETRRRDRFGTHYTISKSIADSVRKAGRQDPLVLLPPNNYFKQMGMDYYVPVSPVFYYFTGMRSTWANNADAMKADCYVRIVNGKIVIEWVTDRKALQETIDAFQKLGVTL
jgi:hypothetical protein